MLQSVKGGLWLPGPLFGILGTPSYSSQLIDATGEKVGMILEVPKTGTIDTVGFRTGTVTLGDTLKIGLYTVDIANGNPTTTAYGSSTTVTQVIADANDNVWFTVTLGTGATATKGDIIAVVIEYNAYVAGNMNISGIQGGSATAKNFPYSLLMTAGSWTKSTSSGGIGYLKYSDSSVDWIPGLYPFSSITNLQYTVNSATDEYGMKFKLPFPARIAGVYSAIALAGDTDIKLYDSDGSTVLATRSWESNFMSSSASRSFFARFNSPQILRPNTYYRVTFVPTVASNVTVAQIDVPEAVALDQIDGGQDFHLTKRVDAGSFTDVTTQRLDMSLIFDAFDTGVKPRYLMGI